MYEFLPPLLSHLSLLFPLIPNTCKSKGAIKKETRSKEVGGKCDDLPAAVGFKQAPP